MNQNWPSTHFRLDNTETKIKELYATGAHRAYHLILDLKIDLHQGLGAFNFYNHGIHSGWCYNEPYRTLYIQQYGRLSHKTTTNDSIKYICSKKPSNDIPDIAFPVTVYYFYDNVCLHILPSIRTHSPNPSHIDESFKIILSNSPGNIQLIAVIFHLNGMTDNDIKYLAHNIFHIKVIIVSEGAVRRLWDLYALTILPPEHLCTIFTP